VELNKTINKLNTDKKNLSMIINVSKEKREEMEKKYKDSTDRYTDLMVIILIILQNAHTNNNIHDK